MHQKQDLYFELNNGTLLHVSSFDGASGECEIYTAASFSGSYETAELKLSLNRTSIWSGIIRLMRVSDTTTHFDICQESMKDDSYNGNTTEIIEWSNIPRVLNISEGGYIPISNIEMSSILDDLIEYHSRTSATVYYERESGKLQYGSVKLSNQRNLKTHSHIQILTDGLIFPEMEAGEIVVLQVELFETTYTFLTILDMVNENQMLLALTSCVFYNRRRTAKRITVSSVEFENCKVVNVSDNGMLVIAKNNQKVILGGNYEIKIGDTHLDFTIVGCRAYLETQELNLHLTDYSSESRKVWQGFLLKFQYPLLSYRNTETHESLWSLYHSTGFMNFPYTELVRESKLSIFKAWNEIDNEGPNSGATVIGFDGEKPVCSIGVARVSNRTWVAQAAAVADDPKYLDYTRSMYSWRTRFILQQPDGEYHLAFFHRDKKFLDRFFRKFYLKHIGTNEESRITWDEWKMHVQKNEKHKGDRKNAIGYKAARSPHPFEKQFLYKHLMDSRPEKTKIEHHVGCITVQNRPHLHMTQYLTSIWLNTGPNLVKEDEVFHFFDGNQPFYSIYAPSDDPNLLEPFFSIGPVITEGWHVVWTCHRSLLNAFLTNSLKSLEQMIRKYGSRSTA